MSYIVGPASGALVAGGVYYGFSNLMRSRTEQHRKDLHRLSVRLLETPTPYAPPPAASKIEHNEFSSYVKSRWNQEIAYLFAGFQELDNRGLEWGRKLLHGTAEDEKNQS